MNKEMTAFLTAISAAIACFVVVWALKKYSPQDRQNREIEQFLVGLGKDELEASLV